LTGAAVIVYLGVKGAVIALDRTTGRQLWAATLKGAGFVNDRHPAKRVLASNAGEIFSWTPPPASCCGTIR